MDKNKQKFFLLVTSYCLLVALFFSGCVSVPVRETLATYDINGATYVSLASLADSKGLDFNYDTFTRVAVLKKGAHEINLWVGDTLTLVDGKAQRLAHPVDIYQGAVVVPYKFKEQVLDVLFGARVSSSKASLPPLSIRKVIVDAGHGGKDPGTIGKVTGLREKDVVLDVAKRLSKLLRESGIEVVMTRSTDNFIPLSGRVDIANKAKADLFISVHANANRVRSLNGFEAYYVAPSVGDSKRALSAAQNAVLNLDKSCFAGNSVNLKAILWDMIYTYDRAESIELGRAICRSIGRNLDTKVIGVKSAGFYVLKGARMPAILAEIGFLSNASEERLLKNGYYRQQVAEAIAQGLEDYGRGLLLVERE